MAGKVNLSPVKESERYIILDALRGLALLGIAMANFPEFSLYSFMEPGVVAAFSSAKIDYFTQYFLYIFVDGKFYTIFSLLFGIGFSIILSNASKKGKNGLRIFYRRMSVLLCIGLLHLMLVWSGDILMLYAIVGMTLPLFTRCSERQILIWAVFFLFLPVIIDSLCQLFGVDPSAPLLGLQNYLCAKYGITEVNFAYWLHDARNYGDVLKFLVQGSMERMWEFVNGNRYFKVLGLFLIGYWIGRNKFYAEIGQKKRLLEKVSLYGVMLGIPLSVVYAWSCMNSHPVGKGFHSLLYFVSVYVTSFGYVALICRLYLSCSRSGIWRLLAAPGRMALTNYIGQSLIGMWLFYGIGFALGTVTGLFSVECIVAGIFAFEILFSRLWLGYFRFGPLEWIWRCLTYSRWFQIVGSRADK